MAEHIHDAESFNLGSSSTRDYRNAFWARVIGCAYHGHPIYNANPDKQWHLKKASESSPQSDDVATSMPTRNAWDCIPGAGAEGYRFEADHIGVLPTSQVVYVPPVPAGSTGPIGPVNPGLPSYEAIGGDAFFRAEVGVPLEADTVLSGGTLNNGSSVWFSRSCYDILAAKSKDINADVKPIMRKHRNDWRALMPPPPGGWPPF